MIFDPISAASTSVAAKMQTTGDEDQSRVVTRDDDYDDFTTGPNQEFLRKARLAKPVSTEQPSKRRKTVMFQEVSPVTTDGQKSTSSHSIRRVSEIGVSSEREQLKSVPSSSSTPEGSSKPNLDMEQIKSYIKTYDEHTDAKRAGCTEELSRQHSPHMKHLEDVLISDKEEASIKDLGKHHTIVMDGVNATLTESEQDALDTLIFGLSTPSNISKFDVVTPNLVTESQWSLPDSQFSPDFPDAQVRELEVAKVREVKHKSPVKRNRKKSKIFRSPYITKFGSCSKVEGSSDNEEKQRISLVLAVIVLKERTIRVYDSLSSRKKSEPPTEKRKLAAMLPNYLSGSDFFEKIERVDWSILKAYEGKLGLQTGEISHNPFDVEYVQNIPQQAYDSLDCGVFVAAYVEILSEGQQVPLCEFEAASQSARYALLL
ncbi:hypothetical protein CQW23_10247 [Capsicum baccatum]|uniref:Ubiquitin-like protease family profile domain-containing protein n=1 Tax=Capsicum baccatum TaxID=33114 RepID=A0A2G2WZ72_CAPBA|nr:hypothetical protein CQW23_10247 [Capsicum baccatum]